MNLFSQVFGSKSPPLTWQLGNNFWLLCGGTVITLVLAIRSAKILITRRRMPPGPTGLPFIGNKHQMPSRKPWKKFAELNQIYGPVVSLFFGKTPIIVLGTAHAAWDLLEKRSEIYSSRPRFVMAYMDGVTKVGPASQVVRMDLLSGEILSNNMRGLMLPYGDPWRRWRKVLHTSLHARASLSYKPIQSLESKLAMFQILEDPKNYEKHLQRYAASIATSVAYGRRVESVDEWVVKENMAAMDYLTSINIPGKYIVESWPWLLKLPERLQWFRYAPLKQRERDIAYQTHLLEEVKTRMVSGSVPDCMAALTLKNSEKYGMTELDVAYAVSSPFGAGIETTAGSLACFILAMLHFPDVMRTAQLELDSMVGFERMPEYDDHDKLPYISAIINETLRWRPIAVLGGQPHAVTQDDWYNGMFIPKGSTVFGNLYGIMSDPVLFPSPDTFDPTRFLNATEPRLQNFDLPFGFGRRICPGSHLALNSLFINIARLLWAFDIRPSLDPITGKEIIPDSHNFTDGFNSKPVSFDCRILPRNERVRDVIKKDYESAKESLSGWNW